MSYWRTRLTMSLIAGLVAVGCGSEEPTPTGPGQTPAPSGSIQVTPGTASAAAVGDTIRFVAVFRDAQGAAVSGQTFTWSSSNTTLATVNSSGLATIRGGDGQVTITAAAEGLQGSATLSVSLSVASVDVTPLSVELLALGLTRQFTAVARDANGSPITGVNFVWSSSDPLVASISPSGLATAVSIGTATLRASVGSAQGTAQLTVSQTGTGTGSLRVIANVSANDVGPGVYTTDFDVTLTDAGLNPVSGATVTVTNAVLGVVTLTETGPGTGLYTATAASFPGGVFELDVASGADSVRDVAVRAPEIHTITQPLASDTAAAGQPLTVLWTVPLQAEGVEIETRDYAPVAVMPDTGAFVIAGADNPANASQRIRVFRLNEVEIGGGLAGSRLQAKIRAEVEPVVVQ